MEIVWQAQEIKIKMVEQPEALDILSHFMLFTDLYHFTELDYRSSTPVHWGAVGCNTDSETCFALQSLSCIMYSWYSSMLRGSGLQNRSWDNACFTDLYHVELGNPVLPHCKWQQTAIRILGQQCIACFTALYHVELGYPVHHHAKGQQTAIQILGQWGIACFTDLYHVQLGNPVHLHTNC